MKAIGQRLIFVMATTAVFVFFSEKAYWYPQGYAIWELLFFYAFPTYVCLWVIDAFRVQRFSQLVLVTGMYAFLIEGVFTPVMFEGGLFNPIMPGYFIGWHGLLAVAFGWYAVRRWLVAGQWRQLLLGSVGFGLFWGTWSLTYWLPEAMVDFPAGTDWTTVEFGLHALTFTLMLMVGHGLLARGGWQASFVPTRAEKWVVLAALLFFFGTLSVPSVPLGFLALGAWLTVVFLPLTVHRRQVDEGSLLSELSGTVQVRNLLALLPMPLVATAVYGAARWLQPADENVRLILELAPLLQALVGLALFVWALVVTLRRRREALMVAA